MPQASIIDTLLRINGASAAHCPTCGKTSTAKDTTEASESRGDNGDDWREKAFAPQVRHALRLHEDIKK